MGDLLWPTYDGRATSRRSRPCRWPTVACPARPTSSWCGPPPVAGPGRPVRPAGRRPVGAAVGANLRRAAGRRAPLRQRVPRTRCAPHRRGRPAGSRATSSSPRPWRRSSRYRRADQQRPVRRAHRELLRRSGARVLVARAPTSRDLGQRPGLAVEAGIENLLALRPTGGDAARRSCTRSTACGSATCPRWRRSSRTTASWVSRLGHRPRRPLPHRWDDGHAEARSAHPRQRGHRRLDDRRDQAAGLGVGGLRRAAALPRQRPGRHAARAVVQGAAGGVGRTLGYRDTSCSRTSGRWSSATASAS